MVLLGASKTPLLRGKNPLQKVGVSIGAFFLRRGLSHLRATGQCRPLSVGRAAGAALGWALCRERGLAAPLGPGLLCPAEPLRRLAAAPRCASVYTPSQTKGLLSLFACDFFFLFKINSAFYFCVQKHSHAHT